MTERVQGWVNYKLIKKQKNDNEKKNALQQKRVTRFKNKKS